MHFKIMRFTALGLALSLQDFAFAQTPSEAELAKATTLETVEVIGDRVEQSTEASKSYTTTQSSSATKLDISLIETPQTVNVITHQQMKDFGLSNAREVLAVTPGVIVQNQETDRTSFSSRGSEISNFQTDGLGVPFSDYNYQGSDIDTFVYDRIEVIKGANGLTSSLGDPGASVNFIRKRPTKKLKTGLGLSYGSWNTSRIEGDISGSLNESGSVRARLVAASQEGDSYLDHYSLKKTIISGVIDADITDSTVLTLGHLLQSNNPEGNNWGALPLLDQNGNQLSYSRSFNPVPDWVKWDKTNRNSFVELSQKLGEDWLLKATYQLVRNDEDSALVYYMGAPDANGDGVSIYSALYNNRQIQKLADVNLSGSFPLFGQRHEAVLGGKWSKNEEKQRESNADAAPQFNWNGWDGQFARPNFTDTGDPATGALYSDEINSIYGATRLHLTDELRVLLGANHTRVSSSGSSYGVGKDYDKARTLPYAGITYNINPTYTAYTSYSTIFRPQSTLGTDGKPIEPVEGEAYEVGVKAGWFDERLTGTLALFDTQQDHFPLRASDSASIVKRYEVGHLKTQGYELSLAGKVAECTDLSLGFTHVRMRDLKSNSDTRTYLPTRYINLLVKQEVPTLPALKVGAGVTWQTRTYQDIEASVYGAGDPVPYAGRIRQGSYALLNLMASYDLTSTIAMQVNADNVTNKKYLNSFPDGQGYYGAPAHYTVGVSYNN